MRLIGIILAGLGVVILLTFIFVGLFRPKVAGIFVETSPTSVIFIDGVQVGRSPYRGTTDPGEVVIRLIPETFSVPLAPYETKVTLASGVETVVRREFGEFEETSTGEIISFEKIAKDEISLAIITIPDSAQLVIDGRDRAFSPHKTSSLVPGEHTLVVSASGYLDKVLRVKTHNGYKLTAFVKLAKVSQAPSQAEQVSPSPTVVPQQTAGKRTVEILSTPTGFLRVRQEPSSLANEVGQVKPGEKYILLEVDEKTGWFKIEFEAGDGWISNQYAKEIKDEDSVATSSATLTPTKATTPTPQPTP